MITSETCYAITRSAEYLDYSFVYAIFTTKEAAEVALLAYISDDEKSWWIEELPLDPLVPSLPPGQLGFKVIRRKSGKLWCCKASAVDVIQAKPVWADEYEVTTCVFARDEDHAIKIASERFAQYDAQRVGIA